MKKYKYIIFDFDGTINDTKQCIVDTYTATLDSYNIPYTSADIQACLGPTLEHNMKRLMGAEWREGIDKYKEIFHQSNGLSVCNPYEGIIDVITQLYHKGYILSVATNKHQPFAEQSLLNLGISEYFVKVYGQTDSRPHKDIILAQLIEDNHYDKSQCLMIGDTVHDVNGAHTNGIDVLAVCYGFGTRDSLLQCNATYIVDNAMDILTILGEQGDL